MANNRYYLLCPKCQDTFYMGKSLGDGIYNNRAIAGKVFKPEDILSGQELSTDFEEYKAAYEQLEEQYTWMWKHLMECISDEFTDQTIFEVIPEYHKRFEPSPPNNDKGEHHE